MSDETRMRWLGYEIQHVFVREIATSTAPEAVEARALLQSIGFDLESVSNKKALLRSTEVRDALLAAPASVTDALKAAGFGLNTHDSRPESGGLGTHPEYNKFNIAALARLNAQAQEEGWTREARERAVFDLHRFMTTFTMDGSIPIFGTPQTRFDQAWAAWRGNKNYGDLSATEASLIDAYRNSFDATLIDNGSSDNSKLRYRYTQALYSSAAAILTPEELANAKKALDIAGPNGSNSGHASSAVASLIHDLQRRSSSPVINRAEAIEAVSAKLHPGAPTGMGFERLLDALTPVFEFIGGYADQMADTIADFGKSAVAAAGRSVNSILVGLGGNAIGDVVEFLNMAYEPIKKGFKTGEWDDFGGVVAQYGVAAVASAVLVVGSVAVTSALVGIFSAALAPVAAAFVAAGWAAYGLYDAITNGIELFGKISADLAEGIEKIGETIKKIGQAIEKYSQIIQRIVANAMDVDFNAPIFNGDEAGRLATKNLVDPLNPALPAFIEGSTANERFYGKNNAFIDAKGGNDEIYVRDVSTALGGAGNDIVAGGRAKTVSAGALLDPTNPNGARAETDLQMTLDGGEGNDWVIAINGEKAITTGGLGRDWIYNTSKDGKLYGDTVDGLYERQKRDSEGKLVFDSSGKPVMETVPVEDASENSDNFWYWADTTIMDAQHFDVLKYFGLPLTGGDANGGVAGLAIMNGLFGAAIGMANVTRYMTGQAQDWTGEVYIDHIQPWMIYTFQRDEDGNLDMYITNAFEQIFRGMMAAVNGEAGETPDNIHKGWMKIENVDVVGSRLGLLQRELTNDVFAGRGQGDLGMVFRAVNPLQALLPVINLVPGLIGQALYYSVFADAVISSAEAARRFAKAMDWANGTDPLVIDLDGDGIETISREDSRAYFDVDGDLFRERTGWLKGDDGFLVLDGNGNGRVDGMAELFGDRAQGGFAELAAYDSNGDGRITAADVIWKDLQVWQDKDRDGETDGPGSRRYAVAINDNEVWRGAALHLVKEIAA